MTKEEKTAERKLIVHKVAINRETAKNIVDRDKTKFFAKAGFLKSKPKREEIEVESILLFYDPFLGVKANYFLDFYEKKIYRVKVGDEASEVVVFDQTLEPEVVCAQQESPSLHDKD